MVYVLGFRSQTLVAACSFEVQRSPRLPIALPICARNAGGKSSRTSAGLQEVELAFYGDSVVELLRGTVHMEPDPRGHGIPEVFHQHFGQKYRTAAFGISGMRPGLALRLSAPIATSLNSASQIRAFAASEHDCGP